jgi:hypothetical protein
MLGGKKQVIRGPPLWRREPHLSTHIAAYFVQGAISYL